jgi:hypothetical protein
MLIIAFFVEFLQIHHPVISRQAQRREMTLQ